MPRLKVPKTVKGLIRRADLIDEDLRYVVSTQCKTAAELWQRDDMPPQCRIWIAQHVFSSAQSKEFIESINFIKFKNNDHWPTSYRDGFAYAVKTNNLWLASYYAGYATAYDAHTNGATEEEFDEVLESTWATHAAEIRRIMPTWPS